VALVTTAQLADIDLHYAVPLLALAWLQRYPYPFIDVSVLGYPRVAVNSVILLAAYVMFGYFVWGIGRVRRQPTPAVG
jgi:hypothetical protein